MSHDGPKSLPMDPGNRGKRTHSGIDKNDGGIRGDITINLYANYPDDEQKAIRPLLGKIATNRSNAISNSPDLDTSHAHRPIDDQLHDCLENIVQSGDSYRIKQALDIELMNTVERFKVWQKYQESIYTDNDSMKFSKFNIWVYTDYESDSPLPKIEVVITEAQTNQRVADERSIIEPIELVSVPPVQMQLEPTPKGFKRGPMGNIQLAIGEDGNLPEAFRYGSDGSIQITPPIRP